MTSVHEGEVYKLMKYISGQCNHIRQMKVTPEILEGKSDTEIKDIHEGLELLACRVRWFYIHMYHKWSDTLTRILPLVLNTECLTRDMSVIDEVASEVKILTCMDLMMGRIIDEDTLLILLIRLDSLSAETKLIMNNIALSLRTRTLIRYPVITEVNLIFRQLDTWNKVGAVTIGFLHCPFHLATPYFEKLNIAFSKSNPSGVVIKYEDCLSVEKYLNNLDSCYNDMYKLLHISNIVDEIIPLIQSISLRDEDGRLLKSG